jgi:hypothetical protein
MQCKLCLSSWHGAINQHGCQMPSMHRSFPYIAELHALHLHLYDYKLQVNALQSRLTDLTGLTRADLFKAPTGLLMVLGAIIRAVNG